MTDVGFALLVGWGLGMVYGIILIVVLWRIQTILKDLKKVLMK